VAAGDVSSELDREPSEAQLVTARRSRPVRIVFVCILAVAALVATGAAGWVIGDSGSTKSDSASSADAGFARDMSTHHTQAITMANYERDNTTNPSLKLLSYDIETSQNFQLGQLQGWLDGWGLSRTSDAAQMSWMAGHGHLSSNGLMPGMATPDQIAKLETMRGAALDVYFLQLMIYHHQGGIPMARYAEQHASVSYVRTMAASIVSAQSGEVITMEQLLRQLGGSPLPAPAS
jgi:uncharacterized protein (DUF305 family)